MSSPLPRLCNPDLAGYVGFACIALVLSSALACSSPFRSPNSDLFVDCKEESKLDKNPMVTRFLADKEKQTVLMEYWTSPRDRPTDVDSVPMDNCTVHDEAHWFCSSNGGFFSTSYSRSGDVVKSTYDEPRGRGFSTSCYQKM